MITDEKATATVRDESRDNRLEEAEKHFRDMEERTALWSDWHKYQMDRTPKNRARYEFARERLQQLRRADEQGWQEYRRKMYADRPDLLQAYEHHLARMKALEIDSCL